MSSEAAPECPITPGAGDSELKLVMAQVNLLVGDVVGNVQKILDTCEYAKKLLMADLVLFPELTLTGYPPEDLLLRPGLQQAVDQGLAHLCQNLEGIQAVLGYPRMVDGVRYNCAGWIADGKVAAEYHKRHLPNYAVFDELRYFEPGSGEPCVIEVKGVRCGLTVCEDIWYPGPAQAAKEAGAQVLLNLNASPFHRGKSVRRVDVVQDRVSETGLPVVYTNMVGGQDELVFDGGSFVMNAQGEMTQRSAWFEEDAALVTVLVDEPKGPAWVLPGELSPDYPDLANVYSALVTGTRDYVHKNGFEGAVLGLSGGIDSALVLAIAADALGAESVHAVLMPSRYTADMSNEDAVLEAQALGVSYDQVPIETIFNAFLDLLGPVLDRTPPGQWDTTEENLQARCRGVILMALSNRQGKMLLTTGNKSEMSVGYATLYGDMAGGYAPIKDCPKMLVYALAKYRNAMGPVIPERVITRPPSAELRPDQVDQDSLPPYEVLDEILERYIEKDQSIPEIIAAGLEEETVRRVTRMVDFNEYKRRQAPPGVRITQRAFGRDRRYPIASGYDYADPGLMTEKLGDKD